MFETLDDISNPFSFIDEMMISYGCVYKRSCKPVLKGSRVETLENAGKAYKLILEEDWGKTSIFEVIF